MTNKWHKIYKKYGLNSLHNINKKVYILVDKDTIYKAKLIKNNIPCITIDEQYCWDIENIGTFCLIEPDYWCEI